MICALLTAVPAAHGDDVLKHLSLGYDRLNQFTYDDPKAAATKAVTANYGFNGVTGLRPYLGTGFAVTVYPELKPGDSLKMNAGIAGKAGLMYQVDKNATLNFDYKYLYMSPDTTRGDSGVRPQSIGVGLDIRF